MSLSLRGLGYGLATAIGFPLALVSALAGAGELVGSGTAMGWFHPMVPGLGFVLTGVGLYGLSKRLGIASTPLNVTIWGSVALGLLGTADIYYSGRFFGSYAVPSAFVFLISGITSMGFIALRMRAFGVLSWLPLAVTISAGVCFLSLFPWFGGGNRDVTQASALVVHIVLWFVLGGVLAAGSSRIVGRVPSIEPE